MERREKKKVKHERERCMKQEKVNKMQSKKLRQIRQKCDHIAKERKKRESSER